jgi:hypothetical protein
MRPLLRYLAFLGALVLCSLASATLAYWGVRLLLDDAGPESPPPKAVAEAALLRRSHGRLTELLGAMGGRMRRRTGPRKAVVDRWLAQTYLPGVDRVRKELSAAPADSEAVVRLLSAADAMAAAGRRPSDAAARRAAAQELLDAGETVDRRLRALGSSRTGPATKRLPAGQARE